MASLQLPGPAGHVIPAKAGTHVTWLRASPAAALALGLAPRLSGAAVGLSRVPIERQTPNACNCAKKAVP